jgi:hypothetical protein
MTSRNPRICPLPAGSSAVSPRKMRLSHCFYLGNTQPMVRFGIWAAGMAPSAGTACAPVTAIAPRVDLLAGTRFRSYRPGIWQLTLSPTNHRYQEFYIRWHGICTRISRRNGYQELILKKKSVFLLMPAIALGLCASSGWAQSGGAGSATPGASGTGAPGTSTPGSMGTPGTSTTPNTGSTIPGSTVPGSTAPGTTTVPETRVPRTSTSPTPGVPNTPGSSTQPGTPGRTRTGTPGTPSQPGSGTNASPQTTTPDSSPTQGSSGAGTGTTGK